MQNFEQIKFWYFIPKGEHSHDLINHPIQHYDLGLDVTYIYLTDGQILDVW